MEPKPVDLDDVDASAHRQPPPPEAGRDGLVWLIKEMTVMPTHWYRYRVRGEIWDQGRFIDTFSWHVPNVDDRAYYIPPA